MGDSVDLQRAADLARDVVQKTPEGHTMRAMRLRAWAKRLHSLHQITGDADVLSQSIHIMLEALELTPTGHDDRPVMLNTLATMYSSRHHLLRSRTDLDRAIQHTLSAAKIAEGAGLSSVSAYNNLGCLYKNLYEASGYTEHLKESLQAYERAIAGAIRAEATQDEVLALANYAGSLNALWNATGDFSLLQTAERTMRQAVEQTPSDHAHLPARQNVFGAILLNIAEHTGRDQELTESIRFMDMSLEARSPMKEDRAIILHNAGTAYSALYERHHRRVHLDKAIDLTEQSISLTPRDHVSRSDRLHNLANYLARLYDRTHDDATLERSLQLAKEAMNGSSSAFAAVYLSGLANRAEERYNVTLEPRMLDNAVKFAEKALDLTPAGDPLRAARMSDLAVKLVKKFVLDTEKSEVLERAHLLCETAVSLARSDDRHLTVLYYHLAKTTWFRGRRDKDPTCVREVIQFYRWALQNRNGRLVDRLRAALEALPLAQMFRYNINAIRFALEAMKLLADTDLRNLDREDQQFMILRIPDLGVDVCGQIQREATDLHDHSEIGLAVLEATRGIMLRLVVDRSDLNSQKLAATTGKKPDALLKGSSAVSDGHIPSYDECIARDCFSRTFYDIVPALSRADFREVADGRTVVVVAVSRYVTAYAIVITSEGATHYDLRSLQQQDVSNWNEKRLTHVSGEDTKETMGTKNKEYREFLGWLWDVCVQPVLCGALHFAPVTDSRVLPRVCWIGAGMASNLPFHAAGYHSSGSVRNTMSLAVSSYAATLRTLRSTRQLSEKARAAGRNGHSMLAVAMPTTPGLPPLHSAMEEVGALRAWVECDVASLTQPGAETVLSLLPKYDFVHFACHGIAHPDDPSKSSLVFQKSTTGTPSSELMADHLRVQDIADVKAERGRLAFLSACSTARNEVDKLKDEVFHLASSFQVAGYSHVVAALWAAPDGVCLELAGHFHAALYKTNISELRDADIACALHEAVLAVRDSGRNRSMPLRWAQYVHYGP